MDYPEYLLRGITTMQWIEDGEVTMAAFQFDEEHIKDDWMQQSVCWEDNASVVDFMLQEKRDDQPKYKAGIGRLPRNCIHELRIRERLRNIIWYERDEIPGENPYHGNLLVKIQSNRNQRRIIAAELSLNTGFIPRQDIQITIEQIEQ